MTGVGWLCTTACAVLGVAALTAVQTPKLLLWNASASAPIGLYALQEPIDLDIGALSVAAPPRSLAAYLAERGYLPLGVPILKRVAAFPGQHVCRDGLTVTVDGIELGRARDRDGKRRPLPNWQGCRIVTSDEIFLMNWQAADSFDGRYFGPFPASAVIGHAIPLFTDEDGDGRFVWRAPMR